VHVCVGVDGCLCVRVYVCNCVFVYWLCVMPVCVYVSVCSVACGWVFGYVYVCIGVAGMCVYVSSCVCLCFCMCVWPSMCVHDT